MEVPAAVEEYLVALFSTNDVAGRFTKGGGGGWAARRLRTKVEWRSGIAAAMANLPSFAMLESTFRRFGNRPPS